MAKFEYYSNFCEYFSDLQIQYFRKYFFSLKSMYLENCESHKKVWIVALYYNFIMPKTEDCWTKPILTTHAPSRDIFVWSLLLIFNFLCIVNPDICILGWSISNIHVFFFLIPENSVQNEEKKPAQNLYNVKIYLNVKKYYRRLRVFYFNFLYFFLVIFLFLLGTSNECAKLKIKFL